MNEETGPDAYLRQQQAITTRADSLAGLAAIACPTLVLVGDGDQLTPPTLAHEMAAGIRGAARRGPRMRSPVVTRAAGRGDQGDGRMDAIMIVGQN
jgi:pimeloyl-ACP methyl ester carboxylesterase